MNAVIDAPTRRDLDVEWRDRSIPEAMALYQGAGWPVRLASGQVRCDLGAGWVALVYTSPDSLAAFVGALGTLPDAPELVVPGGDGARARLYRSAEARTAIDLHGAWPGVSVWASGRSLLLPPGATAGQEVRWRRGHAPAASLELPDLPRWLVDVTLDPIVAVQSAMKAGRPSTDAPCTDLGNAERMARRHGRDIRWCEDWGTWLIWTGTHWERDRLGEMGRFAADTAREIAREAADCDHDGRRKALIGHALKSEAAGRLAAMQQLARSQPGLALLPDAFDQDGWALPCANGTLDLRTGTLRPSRRDDLSTRSIDVAWNLTAECPRWEAFLARVQPDPSVRSFLQRWAGYACTGVIREHVFVIHHGTGRNGKGVFVNAIMHVLGRFARQVPTDLLIETHGPKHPVDKMTLRGVRFASASETEAGARLATTVVKALTGGDTVSARGMGENFTEWKPTHKVALQTNPKPVIRETGPAIRERLLLVPWSVFMPEHERDLDLGEKLQAEAPGILRWLVNGCLAWQREGLSPPDSVRLATSQYLDDQDVVGQFLAARTTTTPAYEGATVRENATALYQAFVKWCEGQSRKPDSQTLFGGVLEERGFTKDRKGTVWRVGLRLLTEVEMQAAAREAEGPAQADDTGAPW